MPLVTKTFSEIITFTRASSGTYFDATGTLQTATTNAARFDYDPSTLAARGFLVEEQRTNLLTYSADFSNAAWSKTGTLTADQINSPAGTLTADLLTASASTYSGLLRANPNPTITSATTYTLSAFFKKNNWRYVGLRFNTSVSGATEQVPFYDFDTDTVSNGGVTGATITRTLVGNGWVRVAVTFTSTSTTGTTDIWLTDSAGATQPAKAGTESVYVWGAQLEAGAFPTSYIATTTASATRSADVASVNTLSPWYNASEGTIYAEAVRSNIPASTNGNIVDISDGTISPTNNRSRLWMWSGSGSDVRFTVVSGGSTVVDLVPGSLTANTVFKVAGTYKLNDFSATRNAGTVVTDTSGAVAASQTTMNIGAVVGGASEFWNGHIRRITYYPRKLSNSEIQGITT